MKETNDKWSLNTISSTKSPSKENYDYCDHLVDLLEIAAIV